MSKQKTLSSPVSKKPKLFYGWFIVAACFAVTLTLGEAFASFGIFLKPLQGEFGWNRAIVSTGYTTLLIGYAISTVIAGRLADRYSPRPILIATAVLAGLGFYLCSLTQDINQFRAFNFIAGIGSGATWTVPSSIVQRWFYGRSRAGLALAIVVTGIGAGSLVFAPLVGYLILNYGWRSSYQVISIIFFVILAASSFVIRSKPIEEKTTVSKSVISQDWSTRKIVRVPSFWGITFLNTAMVVNWQTIFAHLVPHATDIGIAPMTSAVALGLVGGFSIPGRLVSGFISDRLPWKKIQFVAFCGVTISMVLLLFVKDVGMLYIFVFLFGVSYGLRAPAHAGILAEFFGMHSIGEIIGITAAIAQFAGGFAPLGAGYIFDRTGGYSIAFIILTAFALGAVIVSARLRKPVLEAQSR